YELRSYESSTEKLHVNKVKMFNKGGEIKLFKRLGFNTVFCGRVLAGSHMPNLMYMTTFENKAARDEHWKAFSADPEWKTLSAMPEYKNNVSKNEQKFFYPVEYSDI
ncbi:MAG TPA: NIPSNAP family protein, partial [Hymenobacter sp.]